MMEPPAVVEQLSQVLQCRILFSAHYHFLVDQFVGNPSGQLATVGRDSTGGADNTSFDQVYNYCITALT